MVKFPIDSSFTVALVLVQFRFCVNFPVVYRIPPTRIMTTDP